MEDFSQYLSGEGLENLEKARHLEEEESLRDPPEEPYKSKYAARALLIVVKANLVSFVNDTVQDQVRFAAAGIEAALGINFVSTEEASAGEEHITNCLKMLDGREADRRACLTALKALNQLGILWADRGECSNALEYLSQAENLYIKYTDEVGAPPFDLCDIFKGTDAETFSQQGQKLFDRCHTHTLYYLAQVHHNLEQPQQSAYYCQVTLKRQLILNEYDPADWALNCAVLSQFYVAKCDFTQARHCLASASHVMGHAERSPPSLGEGESDEAHAKKLADIARCWAKYCAALLQESRDRVAADLDDDDDLQPTKESADDDDDKERFVFDTLELTHYEEEVTDVRVANFEQARGVFLVAQRRLADAREFYSLYHHASDYAELARDSSLLYKLLAFFEPDFERKSKMHKRRVDALCGVLGELNPRHYLLICRQLMYEIAEAYGEMLDIKMAIVEEHQTTPSPHAVRKINSLCAECIRNFELFLDSFKTNDVMPEQFDSDNVRPVLIAYFYMGRMHSKVIDSDVHKRIEYIEKSIDCYQFLVSYCEKYPEVESLVKGEYDVCKEMVTLLPVKIERLRRP
ncbi:PREDICTED: KIF1-binding protein homolog [Priapulus caudatus]|uniref:KIF-binding protein n=1 Tax=Priapulus caudatus TaxID=37621 RepID=A0ABM1F5G6_PRICU|nr:PREDICTED: KIF1-binding protein homolog [Priapulus caudatus]